MGFNPNDYTMVVVRKKEFLAKYPTGVIHPEMVCDADQAFNQGVVFKASIWKEYESCIQGHPPNSIGYSLSIKGGLSDHWTADETSWVENCETSAIGRALAHMGFGGDKCSREEMEQAQHNKKAMAKKPTLTPEQISEAKTLQSEAIRAVTLDTKQKLGVMQDMLKKGTTAQTFVSITPEEMLEGKDRLKAYIAAVDQMANPVDSFVDDIASDPQMEELTDKDIDFGGV